MCMRGRTCFGKHETINMRCVCLVEIVFLLYFEKLNSILVRHRWRGGLGLHTHGTPSPHIASHTGEYLVKNFLMINFSSVLDEELGGKEIHLWCFWTLLMKLIKSYFLGNGIFCECI